MAVLFSVALILIGGIVIASLVIAFFRYSDKVKHLVRYKKTEAIISKGQEIYDALPVWKKEYNSRRIVIFRKSRNPLKAYLISVGKDHEKSDVFYYVEKCIFLSEFTDKNISDLSDEEIERFALRMNEKADDYIKSVERKEKNTEKLKEAVNAHINKKAESQGE